MIPLLFRKNNSGSNPSWLFGAGGGIGLWWPPPQSAAAAASIAERASGTLVWNLPNTIVVMLQYKGKKIQKS
jgi:hypothetical protein